MRKLTKATLLGALIVALGAPALHAESGSGPVPSSDSQTKNAPQTQSGSNGNQRMMGGMGNKGGMMGQGGMMGGGMNGMMGMMNMMTQMSQMMGTCNKMMQSHMGHHGGSRSGGATVITLISDDNFSAIERTLLLQFTLLQSGSSQPR